MQGITPEQAQQLYEQRQQADPGHDRGGCWCCCLDCDFNYELVTAASPGD